MVFREKQITGKGNNVEYRQGIAASWVSNICPRVPTSSFLVGVQALFYGFDMFRALEGLLSELFLGNLRLEIPTYVRNDNSTVSYQVNASNIVANAKRVNGFLASNREELDRNNWPIMRYIPGGLGTSDGLTKSKPIAILRSLFKWGYSACRY